MKALIVLFMLIGTVAHAKPHVWKYDSKECGLKVVYSSKENSMFFKPQGAVSMPYFEGSFPAGAEKAKYYANNDNDYLEVEFVRQDNGHLAPSQYRYVNYREEESMPVVCTGMIENNSKI